MGFRSVVLCSLLALFNLLSGQVARADSVFNAYVLKAVEGMPSGGGYSVEDVAMERLFASVTQGDHGVVIEARSAQPSFCSSATYLVFLRALALWHGDKGQDVPGGVWKEWVPKKLADGFGVWGRWNANGPGAALLLRETGMGNSFTQIDKALPGDFLKIFWNDRIGSTERGHLVVFLGTDSDPDGQSQVVFWSSNQGMGYGVKSVDRRRIARMLFSRVTDPQRMVSVSRLAPKSGYLSEITNRSSSEREMSAQLGMKGFPVEKGYEAELREPLSKGKEAAGPVSVDAAIGAASSVSGVEVADGEFQVAGSAPVRLKVLRSGGEDGSPRLVWCPAVLESAMDGKASRVASAEDGVWLGEREVTQSEWEKLMGRGVVDQAALMLEDEELRGGKRMRDWLGFGDDVTADGALRGKGDEVAVYYITGDEAREYCVKLTEMERLAGRLPPKHEYRLPTEVEWERAFRLNGRGRVRTAEGVDDGAMSIPGSIGLRDLDANVSEMCEPAKASGEIEGLGKLDVISAGRDWHHRPEGSVDGPLSISTPLPKGFRLSNVGFRVALGLVRGASVDRR